MGDASRFATLATASSHLLAMCECSEDGSSHQIDAPDLRVIFATASPGRRSRLVRAAYRRRRPQMHANREEAGEPPYELGAMRVCLTRVAWRA